MSQVQSGSPRRTLGGVKIVLGLSERALAAQAWFSTCPSTKTTLQELLVLTVG